MVYAPTHPNTNAKGYVREHILVVLNARDGKPLPDGCEIHHVNGDSLDNRACNLVVCPSTAYHRLLHRRQRALDACGHADWVRCWLCGEWSAPEDMGRSGVGADGLRKAGAQHRECFNRYDKELRARRRERDVAA